MSGVSGSVEMLDDVEVVLVLTFVRGRSMDNGRDCSRMKAERVLNECHFHKRMSGLACI